MLAAAVSARGLGERGGEANDDFIGIVGTGLSFAA